MGSIIQHGSLPDGGRLTVKEEGVGDRVPRVLVMGNVLSLIGDIATTEFWSLADIAQSGSSRGHTEQQSSGRRTTWSTCRKLSGSDNKYVYAPFNLRSAHDR